MTMPVAGHGKLSELLAVGPDRQFGAGANDVEQVAAVGADDDQLAVDDAGRRLLLDGPQEVGHDVLSDRVAEVQADVVVEAPVDAAVEPAVGRLGRRLGEAGERASGEGGVLRREREGDVVGAEEVGQDRRRRAADWSCGPRCTTGGVACRVSGVQAGSATVASLPSSAASRMPVTAARSCTRTWRPSS